jgi:hypothetical protein
MVFAREPWYGEVRAQGVLAVLVAPLLLSTLYWPVLYGIRWVRGAPLEASPESRRARLFAAAAGALAVVFPVALALGLGTVVVYAAHYPVLAAALTLPLLLAALLPVLCGYAALAWKRPMWSVAARIHYSLVTLAVVGFLCALEYWNLLGFRY